MAVVNHIECILPTGIGPYRVITKLRTTLGKFGELLVHVAYFWRAWVGRNHIVNTKFTELSKYIADFSDGLRSITVPCT